jgi:hypothetical protein
MRVSNCLFAFIVCCFPGFRQRMAEAARRPGTYLHNVLGIMGLVARMLGCFRGEVTYPLASLTFQMVERTSQQTSCDRVDMLELVIFDLSNPFSCWLRSPIYWPPQSTWAVRHLRVSNHAESSSRNPQEAQASETIGAAPCRFAVEVIFASSLCVR